MYSAKPYGISGTIRLLQTTLFIMALLTLPVTAIAKSVLIETPLGNFELEMLEEDAPNTVANFLNYIQDDRYENTFVHRSVPDFIIQGGGFIFSDGAASGVNTFEPVENEFEVSNTRGTVAMAKLSDQPDSATSQWFINVADNADSLDNQNGGFTVFARVSDGMDVVDAINALPRANAGGAFSELPVIDFSGGNLVEANMVMTAVSVIEEEPTFVMNAGLNDAWFNPLTDGQGFFITVFPDLGLVSLAWFTYDTELPDMDASANLGDAGHRWLTAIGTIDGDSAIMNIDFTSGGLFDEASIIEHTEPVGSDGTITLTFENCNSATVDYDISSIDRQGSVPIERVAIDNVALCEALKEE